MAKNVSETIYNKNVPDVSVAVTDLLQGKILEKYDREVLLKVRRLNKIMLKITRQKSHLLFNHRCKDRQLLPPSLRIRPPVQCPKGYKLAKNAGFQFLKLRTEQSHKQIRKLNYEKDKQTEFLRSKMEPGDLEWIEALFRDLQQIEHLRMRTAHTKKLEALKANQTDYQKHCGLRKMGFKHLK